MPGSYVVNVPAGTQSLVQAVTPLTNVCAGPAVLGGTVLLETAPTPQGPWSATGAGSATAGQSVRLDTNGYVRCTATTQAANMVISDFSGVNSPGTSGNLISSNAVLASPNSTSIQILYSFRIPPRYLTNPNFRIEMAGSVLSTNNANVKTLTVVMNGAAGSTIQTLAITSLAQTNFFATMYGVDGSTLKGSIGTIAAGGWGGTTTAEVTLARDYINNETEVVVCITKATGTDTVTLNSFRAALYQ